MNLGPLLFLVLTRLVAMSPAAAVADTAPRVWVYFTDKGACDRETERARLADRAAALDPHAARRRAKVLGERLVDAFDLPVLPEYLDELMRLGAHVSRTSRWLNAASVRASPMVQQELRRLPFVHRLAPVRGSRRPQKEDLSASPGPAPARSLRDRFDYAESREQLAEIGVLSAHARGLTGAQVIVAMLDTGFDWDRPAFAPIIAGGRLLAQYDFINDDAETHNEPGDDPSQHTHGTITWSVLAGFSEGHLIGPAFGASFLLAKTEDVTSETPIEEDNWIAAAEWADSLGADVLSSSLIYIDWYQYQDMDGDTAPITIAADVAASRGIVVCSAAGNSATDDWYYIGAPADGDLVMAVGAARADGSRADFSSHGPTYDGRIKPDLMARGDPTWGATPEGWSSGPYDWFSGTSVACPLAAGCVALLLEARPQLTPHLVWRTLTLTADQASAPDNDRGWGRIRLDRALASW